MGQRQRADLSVFLTYTIHHQAKYQRLNANTLYVAAILFSRSTLHREALPCLPNMLAFSLAHVFCRRIVGQGAYLREHVD